MVDPDQPDLSIANQCRLLNINRSTLSSTVMAQKAKKALR